MRRDSRLTLVTIWCALPPWLEQTEQHLDSAHCLVEGDSAKALRRPMSNHSLALLCNHLPAPLRPTRRCRTDA